MRLILDATLEEMFTIKYYKKILQLKKKLQGVYLKQNSFLMLFILFFYNDIAEELESYLCFYTVNFYSQILRKKFPILKNTIKFYLQ